MLDIANDEQAPARARVWFARHGEFLDAATRLRTETCLTEAINNSVAYRTERSPGRIRVRLYRGRMIWVVRVCDSNPSAEQALTDAPPPPEQSGGRGWFIIRQWTAAARYRRSGNRNVVTLALRIDHAPSGDRSAGN